MEDSSENEGILQGDILNKQFAEIQFIKPKHLTEKEELLFRNAQATLRLASSYYYIEKFFSVLRFFEQVYIVSLLSIVSAKNVGISTLYQKLICFFFQQPQDEPNLLLCVIITCLSIYCLFFFLFGLYSAKKHFSLSRPLMLAVYIFSVEITDFSLLILVSQTANLFAQIILGGYSYYMIQFVAQIIVIALNVYINNLNHETVFNSQFYLAGSGASLSSPATFSNSLLIIIFLVTFGIKINPAKLYFGAFSALYIAYGLYFMTKGFCSSYIHNSANAYVASYGFTFIVAGIFSILHSADKNSSPDLYIYSLLVIWIIVYYFIRWILSLVSKRLANKLQECDNDFDKLRIRSVWHLVHYFRSGFSSGIASAINGQLLDWAIQKFNIQDLEPLMIRFATLFKNPPLYMSFLDANFRNYPHLRPDAFVIYEYDLINDMRSVSELKAEYQEAIINITQKISSFSQIELLYAKNVTNKLMTNFYLIQSLHHTRSLIYSFVNEIKARFPNNIQVLKLCALYETFVTKDKSNVDLLKKNIAQLENDPTNYCDILFTIPLTLFPHAQRNIVQQNECELKSFSEEESAAVGEDQQKKSHHLTHKYKPYNSRYYIAYVLMFIAGICVVIIYIANFITAKKQMEENDVFTYLQQAYIEFTSYFFLKMTTVIPVSMGLFPNSESECICNISEEFHHVRGQYAYMVLSEPFQTDSCLNDYFSSSTFMIDAPVFDNNYRVSMPFHIFIDKIYNIILTIFPEADGAKVDDKWIKYIVNTFSVLAYQIAQGKATVTTELSNEYLTCHEKVAKQRVLSIYIPFFITMFLVIVYLLVHIMWTRHIFQIFSDDTSKSNLLVAYLRKYFKTPSKYLFSIAIYVIIIIALIIGSFFVENQLYKASKNAFYDLVNNTISDTRSIFYSFNAINSFQLYNYTNYTSYLTQENLTQYVKRTLEFFGETGSSDNIRTTRTELQVSLLELALIQYSSDEALYTSNTTNEMLRHIFEDLTLPTILNISRENNIERQETSTRYLVMHAQIGEIFYLSVLCLFWIFFIKVLDFMELTSEIKELMKIVVEFSTNTAIRTLKQSKYKTSAQFIIDTISSPIALITTDNLIITVNSSWCAFFEKPEASFIGMNIDEFFPQINEKMKIADVNPFYKIVMLMEQLEERKVTHELEQLKETIISYRCDIGPKRFANWRNGCHEIDFVAVLSCSVYAVTENDDDAMIETNQMIMEMLDQHLRLLGDFDIIKSSARQITIIFGVNKRLQPFQLVAQAVTLAIDFSLCIVSNEYEGITITPTCVVTCGNAIFGMNEERLGTIDISGSAICEVMPLTQYALQGTVTVSSKVVEMLESNGIRHGFKKLIDDAYQLKVDPNLLI
ncbi:hypothetical protein TVAG_045430 [Trichomonas vaginalis G3]|uniref:PAS domain-containing protein n=1 Tax=Trichomonas vaginalis (strain ATCC PRA-98 / G3) TaxID=412133 RepID=A2FHH8_TRIV3|nr:PYP-like sensor domain (PAS domain) family [Trichomonas vaginalis G3]EAX95654.1 hypothetical protein TVAG_045430 [Trichomonas vaginalis G3]KAI5503045.1 PYP-like sensor domain (PAS domain) family [Trichomonas vaginalis G3]|eukprot:XP_001308584.1 hypothetical protein [Trichomonas vaginalis G3]